MTTPKHVEIVCDCGHPISGMSSEAVLKARLDHNTYRNQRAQVKDDTA